MSHDVKSLWIPDEPDCDIQTDVEASSRGCRPWCENATCQVELLISEASNWKIRSRNQQGDSKQCGGDEFYVRYEEFACHDADEELTCQAVALIQDHDDGTYTLDFVSTPMHPLVPNDNVEDDAASRRVLTVYFEYTNAIGRLPPPTKNEWLNGGYTHRCFTRKLNAEIMVPRPPIRPFTVPNCAIDLASFDRVLAFGDSTMDQFVRQRPNKKGKYYFQPNILVGEKIRQAMNSETLESMLESLENEFGALMRRYSTEGRSVCLVLGSCLWDILDSNDKLQGALYKDHIAACREFLLRVRETYSVTIVWKAPMAVHIHWVDLERLVEHDKATATLFGLNRVRYMSASRSFYLYTCQKWLMEDLNVPLLDIYEASYLSASELYPADGRHYRPALNRLMLSWFSPSFSKEDNYYQNVA